MKPAEPALAAPRPPSTRYQGSKLKLLDWIWEEIGDLDFHSALDAFGGTGSVSYLLKTHGKAVTYNDYLRFNQCAGQALIENCETGLSQDDVQSLLTRHRHVAYCDFIAATFSGIYFTDEENVWLDTVCQNIALLTDRYQRAQAYHALFQACLVKRPYNLFHRRNLYMRTAQVERSFGNKAAWDRSFEDHFRVFAAEANRAVFDSGVPCRALCCDALEVPGRYDLVYIDTPYISATGAGTDYLDFYHFLEGLVLYSQWPERIDYSRKHHPMAKQRSPWSDADRVHDAFAELFARYRDSILAVSYRSDGVPGEDELVELMRRVKGQVRVVHYGNYKYVLSKNGASKEILIIGT